MSLMKYSCIDLSLEAVTTVYVLSEVLMKSITLSKAFDESGKKRSYLSACSKSCVIELF